MRINSAEVKQTLWQISWAARGATSANSSVPRGSKSVSRYENFVDKDMYSYMQNSLNIRSRWFSQWTLEKLTKPITVAESETPAYSIHRGKKMQYMAIFLFIPILIETIMYLCMLKNKTKHIITNYKWCLKNTFIL